MEFTREEKLSLMKSLMWDYDIPPEHCPEVLGGPATKPGIINFSIIISATSLLPAKSP